MELILATNNSERNAARDAAISAGDFDLYFELADWDRAAHVDFMAEVCKAAKRFGCVLVRHDLSPIWHYVHVSPRSADDLQVTTWDDLGPVSHEMISRPADLLQDLMRADSISVYAEAI